MTYVEEEQKHFSKTGTYSGHWTWDPSYKFLWNSTSYRIGASKSFFDMSLLEIPPKYFH